MSVTTTQPPAAGRAPEVSRARIDALLVDLDGVVTDTARLHAGAWKQLFDAYLGERAAREADGDLRPFDAGEDYLHYVDGKPRLEGVRSFLASRGIELPEGGADDPPERETLHGLGGRKNHLFLEELARRGVPLFEGAVDLLREARRMGFRLAVVSSSRNCAAVLSAAGLEELFGTRVDGCDMQRLGLAGKPAPDLFLEAARRLRVPPERAAVVEDAEAGVEAGRAGGFALVVGIGDGTHAEALVRHGADVVVPGLADLRLSADSDDATGEALPDALRAFGDIAARLPGRRAVVFLDYDGTLTPIVTRPEEARLAADMRERLRRLARLCPVAVISGRDLPDVTRLVGLEQVTYAGSHGFDIAGPGGLRLQHEEGVACAPALRRAEAELRERLADVSGVQVEGKAYAVTVHYRRANPADVPAVEQAVAEAAARQPRLRRSGGKKILELRPDVHWDKGRAVLWLLEVLCGREAQVLPFYLGDDATDEDAFAAIGERGVGIAVGEVPPGTGAHYRLDDPAAVGRFLDRLAECIRKAQPS